jgi:hypothetical protein
VRDSVLAELYFRQKRRFPLLSTAFILGRLLVTVPSYFNPMWYEVFGGMGSYNFWWQLFTHNLEHGHPYPTRLPAPVHLFVNLSVIATCGVLSERVLGRTRFFLRSVAALAIATAARFLGVVGNGASTIAWSHRPTAAYILWLQHQEHTLGRRREVLTYLFGLVIFCAWGVITIVNSL